ncbi:septal ring lytic transglycosylase RlpA family protein [Porticoccaceae bacterium LTM1]|nr:septal ring lytic transglycosylase RlpA family protein [Porticoccaceae bacterium LTM1]
MLRRPNKPLANIYKALPAAALLSLLGCSTAPSERNPYYADDRPPAQRHLDLGAISDAVPKVEPVTRAGNKNPYTVLNKTYHLLDDNAGYKERGVASWYGTKFHGKKTANGETYDMFAMTAAHKTLRIPAYVKVTNLDNGRQVIVRVNDRGPFLHDRIIDLSYAAAKKLDIADRGTGRVEVEAIDPVAFHQPAKEPAQAALAGDYLQVGAFASVDSARAMKLRVQQHTQYPVVVQNLSDTQVSLYKVLIGPVSTPADQQWLRRLLNEREKLSPFLVQY